MLNNLASSWENLDENYKKIILSILFSAVVCVLGYALYYVFFRPQKLPTAIQKVPETIPTTLPSAQIRNLLKQKEQKAPETESIVPALPKSKKQPDQIAQGGFTQAVPQIYTNAQDVNINKTGNINFFNQDDGKFYTLNKDGQPQALSDQSFPNVKKTTWSPQGNKAILEFPDGSNIYYDFDREEQHTLPAEGQDFNFSSTGNELAYKFLTNNPDENWLVISSPTGNNTQAIEHIGAVDPDDVLINWSPDNSRVAQFKKSSGINSEEIYFVGKNKENFKSLSVKGQGFEGLWSPQSDKLLYNIYNAENGYRPELYITQAQDQNMGVKNKSLGINTWVEKCVFKSDNQTIFCGVPLYLKQGTGLYKDLANNMPDVIYKININTGYKEKIAVPTNSLGLELYTVEKLMLSPDEKTLQMVDNNGGIYKIQLEK